MAATGGGAHFAGGDLVELGKRLLLDTASMASLLKPARLTTFFSYTCEDGGTLRADMIAVLNPITALPVLLRPNYNGAWLCTV